MIKSRAIVLHRFAYSDSSWIVKAFTEECGIISFIVKGGKRKESPFKGALDPLALCEIVFRQNPNTELQFIKEATLLDWRKNLREDLLCLAKAQVMAEMILKYAPQGIPLIDEFALFAQAADDFEKACANNSRTNNSCAKEASAPMAKEVPKANIFAKWLLETCELWGYNLDLHTCSRCDCELEESAADFHYETGFFVCKKCQGVVAPRAKAETLSGLWDLHLGREIQNPQFAENALLAYLRHHIGFLKEIKSLMFLNDTRKIYSV